MMNYNGPKQNQESPKEDILGPQVATVLEAWRKMNKADRDQITFLDFANQIGIEISPPQIEEFNRLMQRGEDLIRLREISKS